MSVRSAVHVLDISWKSKAILYCLREAPDDIAGMVKASAFRAVSGIFGFRRGFKSLKEHMWLAR